MAVTGTPVSGPSAGGGEWPTVAEVVSAAAKESALVTASIADPLASTDANVLMLVELLNATGQMLARQYAWTHLQQEATVTTQVGVSSYALPTGFGRVLDGTMWNRTQQQPTPNANGQQWQMLKAQTASGPATKVARIYGGNLHLYDTPTAVETFAFEYYTRLWLTDSGGATPAETIVAATDLCRFDVRLLVDALKLAFRQEKGFDTTVHQQRFDATLAAVLGGDGLAPTLSLNGSRGLALIGPGNAPEGGYG